MIDEAFLLETLQDLVRCRSVNPSLDTTCSGEQEIGNYLAERLKSFNVEVAVQPVEDNRSNIVGIIKGSGGGKSLLLNGHMDTVGLTGMTIEPLQPEFKQGRLYGRGSEDMKGGIAAIVAAAEAVIRHRLELTGDVILAFVVDEEYKSRGTETLMAEYRADAAIVTEPTALTIALAHKGFAWGCIEVFGKAAHGSRPEEGIDAIVKAGKILAEIDTLQKKILTPKRHPLVGYPSIHASLIEGGREISTYPDYCKIELERRTIPGEPAEILTGELNAVIDRIKADDPQLNARSSLTFSRPSLELSANEPVALSLAGSFKRVTGREPVLGGASFWTDAALIAAAGIPALNFGPSGGGLHGAVEYVDVESVNQTAAVLVDVIADFCG